MGSADTVSLVRTPKSNRPEDGTGEDGLWRAFPGEDPVAAQQAVCESIARILASNLSRAGQLDALLRLDRRAQELYTQLLNRYVEGNAQLRLFERKVWVSALRLSQAFYQAYENFYRHVQSTSDVHFLAHAHSIVVQLFHHRRIEFLLRYFRFKKRIPAQCKELREAYRFAQSRGTTTQVVVSREGSDQREVPTTPEEQYVRLLLLDMMNNGQFSPRELLWADGWFGQWCKLVRLQTHEPAAETGAIQKYLALDPDGTQGLKRTADVAVDDLLLIDPSPLLVRIAEETRLLRESASMHHTLSLAERTGRVALLIKLKPIVDPNGLILERRGERKRVALTVQVIFGLSNIIRVLREEAKTRPRDGSGSESATEGITITPFSAQPHSPAIDVGGTVTLAFTSMGNSPGTAPVVWQVKDRSDSGSRLRGKIDDLNRVIPGSLIAIRQAENGPWTVTVVRRLRRLVVDYVEIGVEHLGHRPRFVKLAAESAGIPGVNGSAPSTQRCFAALYLPPSDRHPKMPIKTLLLPTHEFRSNCNVTLLSSNSTYTLRLNEPIQQQYEFVWTSFTVVDKAHPSSDTNRVAEEARK